MAITKMRFYRAICAVMGWHRGCRFPKLDSLLSHLANGRPARTSGIARRQLYRRSDQSPEGFGSAALRRQIVEPLGELLELPVPRQRRCFAPGRLLPAEPRQWRLAVHGGDRSEQSQILRLRRKATRLKGILQGAVCP